MDQTFPRIAKTLGSALTEEPALRKIIANGLTLLIDHNREIANEKEEATNHPHLSKGFQFGYFAYCVRGCHA